MTQFKLQLFSHVMVTTVVNSDSGIVLHSQTDIFLLYLFRRKGLDQFTVAASLSTPKSVNSMLKSKCIFTTQ